MNYIALLRGINVGGNNIIKMTDLRACLSDAGFTNVETYIQSGNVVFDTKRTSLASLEKKIEQALEKRFGYSGFVVVLSSSDLDTIVREAPRGFGSQPEQYRYDVLFLKTPLTAKKATADVPTNDVADTKYAGSKAVYFRRSIKHASKSRLAKLSSLPVYKHITIRNWNTTTKLLTMSTKA